MNDACAKVMSTDTHSNASTGAKPASERLQVEAMISEGGGVSTFTADPPRGAPFSAAPPPEMSTSEREGGWIASKFEQATRKLGYACLRRLAHQRGRVSESLAQLADAAHRRAEQTRFALGLIDDFKDGSYREVSWSSITILSTALLYISNPRDLLPDLAPMRDLDEITILTLALRLTEKDLRAYCRFKGLREADYFN
jgi:uncharacterized membrane protein YkvA (DUF1232 family)